MRRTSSVLALALALPACTDAATPQTMASSAGGKADELTGGQTSETGEVDPSETDTDATDACPDPAEVFPDAWPEGGPACGEEAPIFVHQYDANTFILRQSICTSFEAPFIYMLFGDDKVLIEDTGDGGIPIADVAFEVIADWLEANDKEDIEVVVVNSHAHGDHVAGNDQFEGFEGVEVVGFTPDDLAAFFEIAWPEEIGLLDLGNRLVDIVPIPGHEESHLALYDENTGLLLTGDTFYPGRLFIDDFEDYKASIERLLVFTSEVPVCSVLGTHIEMTQDPGVDFEFGLDHHPDEHELRLGREHLQELHDALDAMGDEPRRQAHDDFIIFPL